MRIKCQEYDRISVITPGGDLCAEQVDDLRTSFDRIIDRRRISDFVLDCHSVGFIDSAALESLLEMKRRAQSALGRFTLANLDANCREILHVTRLSQRFECHSSLQAALASLR